MEEEEGDTKKKKVKATLIQTIFLKVAPVQGSHADFIGHLFKHLLRPDLKLVGYLGFGVKALRSRPGKASVALRSFMPVT